MDERGAKVQYIVVTDGNIGSHDPDMTSERLAQIRREEQTKAAHIVGAETPIYLGEPDGRVVPTLELRAKLVREIRRFKPNVIITGDPTQFFPRDTYINHPDHRAVATAAIEACFPAPESPLIFPEQITEEGLEPHKPNYVYVSWPVQPPNLFIDISDTLELKLEALRAHKSQIDWDPEERIGGWARETGKRVGMGPAEAFKKITLKEIEPEE